MKSYLQVDELTGMNRSPIAGEFITENDAKFLRAGVTVGLSVLYNMETGVSGTVTGATETRVDATGVPFKPGQPYIVSLPSDWTVTDPADNIPIVDIECKRCGFSFPKKKLVEGYCKDCYDPPRPTRTER
jgi:hypothetical protein